MRGNVELIRYHYDIWFPDGIADMCLDFFEQFEELGTTYHSADQLIGDERGIIPMPTKEDLMHPTNSLVEVYERKLNGLATGVMQKALLRVHHFSDTYDYCYVVSREGFIVSAWTNDKSDIHRLINDHVYARPYSVKRPALNNNNKKESMVA